MVCVVVVMLDLLIYSMKCCVENPLFFAIVCIVFHSSCFSPGFNGKECIRER